MAKKLLSVVLALTMIFTVLCIGTNAEEPSLVVPIELKFEIGPEMTLSSLLGSGLIDIAFDISNSSIGALDGETAAFTEEAEYVAIEVNGVTYFYKWSENFKANGGSFNGTNLTGNDIVLFEENGTFVFDEEQFLNVFTETTEQPDLEDPEKTVTVRTFGGGAIVACYNLVFESVGVFGDLKYTASLTGFSAPPDLGEAACIIGMIGGNVSSITDSVPLPKTVEVSGEVVDFPSIETSSIISTPVKQVYSDMERFNASGLAFNVTLTNGKSGTVTYGNAADDVFTFVPSAKDRLVVGTTEVITKLEGKIVLYTPVVVNHSFTDKPVQIASDIGTPSTSVKIDGDPTEVGASYGQHAIICEGCGEIDSSVDFGDGRCYADCIPDENWVSNGDATFAKDGTATCHCTECGGECTKIEFRSAQYNITFSNMHFLIVIFDYIATLLRGILVITK